jgi:hypothetical protein
VFCAVLAWSRFRFVRFGAGAAESSVSSSMMAAAQARDLVALRSRSLQHVVTAGLGECRPTRSPPVFRPVAGSN